MTVQTVLILMTAFSLLLLWAGLKYIESCAQFLGVERDDYFDEEAGGGNGRGVVPEVVALAPTAPAPPVVRPPPDAARGMVAGAASGGIRIV
ncbi:hypothetical protein HOY82DRAFT_598094 [Tuber indicum]|nr:hypothetical protein HOY82DRAFT_598094 [Tuber indicum]